MINHILNSIFNWMFWEELDININLKFKHLSQFNFDFFVILLLFLPGSDIIWSEGDLTCVWLNCWSLVFGQLLASWWWVRVTETNPGHSCVPGPLTLESEGQVTWEYEPVIMLDHNNLTQITLTVLLNTTLVKWNLESVFCTILCIVKTVFWSEGGKDYFYYISEWI